MNKIVYLMTIITLFTSVACNATGTEISLADSASAEASIVEGEFPLEAQLAIGSLLLEETDNAITKEQAETLLPLWQAFQSLSASGTAADVELEALTNQIQGEMNDEQVNAIQEMALSQESIQTLLQDGTLNFRGFGGGGEGQEGQRGGQGQGGGPFGGGPPGGGEGRGGGIEGLDPETVQTRQAERAANGGGAGIAQFTSNAVIRLLESKTGVAQPNPQQAFGLTLVETLSSELGLTSQELRENLGEDQSIREFVEANGDIEEIEAALISALAEFDLPEDQSAEDVVAAFLDRGFQLRRGQDNNDG